MKLGEPTNVIPSLSLSTVKTQIKSGEPGETKSRDLPSSAMHWIILGPWLFEQHTTAFIIFFKKKQVLKQLLLAMLFLRSSPCPERESYLLNMICVDKQTEYSLPVLPLLQTLASLQGMRRTGAPRTSKDRFRR